ncbi:hypothetical protein [Tardiphaga sp.]|uniref:hypothetical protein n=1 Tax=Tardiphaga sp. TaxID=1926292 RepID=UPI00352A7D30
MLPKRGRIFRNGSGENTPRLVYARAIRQALRSELGPTHQANKRVRQWTGASERTIKNWLNGSSGPRGEHLLLLACHSENVFDVILTLTERDNAVSGVKLHKICDEMSRSLRKFKELMEDKR